MSILSILSNLLKFESFEYIDFVNLVYSVNFVDHVYLSNYLTVLSISSIMSIFYNYLWRIKTVFRNIWRVQNGHTNKFIFLVGPTIVRFRLEILAEFGNIRLQFLPCRPHRNHGQGLEFDHLWH